MWTQYEKNSIADLSPSSIVEEHSSKTSPLPQMLKAEGIEFFYILLPLSRQCRLKFRGILFPKLLQSMKLREEDQKNENLETNKKWPIWCGLTVEH